jgi:predicted nucleotidyltransferase
MTDTSRDLSNKLPVGQVNLIRRVVRTAASLNLTRLFIVGAQARDLVLQHMYGLPLRRATNDIDFGVAVETWDEFAWLRDALINSGFRPHPHQRQRLLDEEEAIVDVVPFGGIERETGVIAWPPDFSIVMRTTGFREAYSSSIDIRLADDLVVKVASLAGVALLKILAWADRRFERDAQDLGLIMKQYLDAGNQDRLFGDQGDCSDLLDEDFDYDQASARVLGRDIERLLTDETRPATERVLAEEADEAGTAVPLVMAMVKNSANYHGDFDLALLMLAQVRRGISDHQN